MGLKDRIQSFFTGLYRSRFSNWITVLGLYMAFSLLIRITFSIWSAGDASYSLYNVSRAYGIALRMIWQWGCRFSSDMQYI